VFYSYTTIDVLCKDLDLNQDFIESCWSIMSTFDRKREIRKMVLKAIKASEATWSGWLQLNEGIGKNVEESKIRKDRW
jgi:hypothetical protein